MCDSLHMDASHQGTSLGPCVAGGPVARGGADNAELEHVLKLLTDDL